MKTERGTGRTTKQIIDAHPGAIYVWVNHYYAYPKQIAKKNGRDDIDFVAPSFLTGMALRGARQRQIIIDHAVNLTKEQLIEYVIFNNSYYHSMNEEMKGRA